MGKRYDGMMADGWSLDELRRQQATSEPPPVYNHTKTINLHTFGELGGLSGCTKNLIIYLHYVTNVSYFVGS